MKALLLVGLVAGAAFAEDTCTLNASAIKPQFAKKLPRGFKLVSTKREKRRILETLKLPDGQEVLVTMGGCEHLGFTIGIKGPTITTKTVGSELVAVARRVLPVLPMGKDVHVDPALMLKAVEDAQINVMPAQLPCGDATCELSLEPIVDPAKKKQKTEGPAEKPARLVLSYDFAL